MNTNPLIGMLTVDELTYGVEAGELDTVLVVFTDLYGRFMGKRFDARFFLDSLAHGSHACDYLLTVDMEMQPVPGYEFANWQRGYGDFAIRPDLTTLRMATWLEKSAIVICDVIQETDGELVEIAPRSLLRRQIEAAAQHEYVAMAGTELEYYLFEMTYREAHAKKFHGLQPAGWYLEDYHMLQGTREERFNGAFRRHLHRSGIPVECSKGEWGLGQHELNLRYADVLSMADRHVIFKQCLKEVAEQQGGSVTFMAKLDAEQAGSSCHIHMSLWHNAKNAFAGTGALGPIQCSPEFGWFLGGWMKHLPELMVCYAPTVNSYKRFQSGSWAPTRLAWCHDNRTASFRVVGHGPSLRIECRIAGADCNPYLALAASLASGLDGIANEIEPPPLFVGDAYNATQLAKMPGSLREATDLFAQSDFAKQAFGGKVVEHYTHFFRTEQAAYDKAVTDWERQRYFERI